MQVKVIKNNNQNKYLVTFGKYFVIVKGNQASKLNKTTLEVLKKEEKENTLIKTLEVKTLEQFYNVVDKLL